MDVAEIPASVVDCESAEVTEATGNLESDPVESNGAVSFPLRTSHCYSKGVSELFTWGAGTQDVRPREESIQRCLVGFRVNRAVIVHLVPGLSGLVEKFEGETVNALEHRHESSLNCAEESLLFAVLMRAVLESCFVNDTEPPEAFGGFSCDHGGAVIGEDLTGNPAFLEAL